MRKAIIKKVCKGRNKGQYRFVFKGDNGKIVGGSSNETYHNLDDCVSTLKKYFGGFDIEYSFVA